MKSPRQNMVKRKKEPVKKEQKEEEMKCIQCDMVFTRKRELSNHMRREHFAGYICDVCGRIFQTSSGMLNICKK